MIDLYRKVDIELAGNSSLSCPQCYGTPVNRVTKDRRGGWFQVACVCGIRGPMERTAIAADEGFLRGDVQSVGVMRSAAASRRAQTLCADLTRHFCVEEIESAAAMARGEDAGFVYVMADFANNEVKVGGTSRDPELRWAEHPRGLVPVCAFPASNWRDLEAAVHAAMVEHRTGREEFFRVTIPAAVECVRVLSERERFGFSVEFIDQIQKDLA